MSTTIARILHHLPIYDDTLLSTSKNLEEEYEGVQDWHDNYRRNHPAAEIA